jgi:hypothetical protein
MLKRTLTHEEFAAAGIPVDNCMRCPRVKGKDEYGGWRYFKRDGVLTVLCPNCFRELTGDVVPPFEVLAFMERVTDLCAYPIHASLLIPAQRSPREWIDYTIAHFREMTPAEISQAEEDCLRDPAPGRPDERERHFDARKVLRCLRIMRQAFEGTIYKMFQTWSGLEGTFSAFMDGEQYAGYRERLRAFAATEFLFGFGMLLSDEIQKTWERAEKKKKLADKKKAFENSINAVANVTPSVTFPGAHEERDRFVEYMKIQIAEIEARSE